MSAKFFHKISSRKWWRLGAPTIKIKVIHEPQKTPKPRPKPLPKPLPVKGDGDEFWRLNDNQGLQFLEFIELARKAVFDFEVPSLPAAHNLVRKSWDYYGPTSEVKRISQQSLSRFNGIRPEKLERLRVLRASIAADSLDYTTLTSQLNTILKCDPGAIARMPVMLAASVGEVGLSNNPLVDRCLLLLEKIEKNQVSFLRKILDGSTSVCIVGNSPCEIGKGLGRKIDAHDIIIRFNNFSTDREFAKDYGVKTNIWMKSGGYSDIWRRPYAEFDYVLFSGPDVRLHTANPADLLECFRFGGNPIYIPAKVYSELARQLKYRPSAGMLLCSWFRHLLGKPDFERFSIYGISLSDQEPNKNNQYFVNTLKKPSYSHNWEAEAVFFRENILE